MSENGQESSTAFKYAKLGSQVVTNFLNEFYLNDLKMSHEEFIDQVIKETGLELTAVENLLVPYEIVALSEINLNESVECHTTLIVGINTLNDELFIAAVDDELYNDGSHFYKIDP